MVGAFEVVAGGIPSPKLVVPTVVGPNKLVEAFASSFLSPVAELGPNNPPAVAGYASDALVYPKIESYF